MKVGIYRLLYLNLTSFIFTKFFFVKIKEIMRFSSNIIVRSDAI